MRRRRLTSALRHRYGHSASMCPAGSQVQALLFPTDRFTVAEAFIHLRQQDPKGFRRIRTVFFGGSGVKARVGWKRC